MLNCFFKDKYCQKGIILLIIVLSNIILLTSCTDKSSIITQAPASTTESPTVVDTPKETISSTNTPTNPVNTPGNPNLPDLPPYPRGWVKGRDGWIPPLPPGLAQPRLLSEEEWEAVKEIASLDLEVSIQYSNNNIGATLHYWVGYSGGPVPFNTIESNIISNNFKLPATGHWYYPALLFQYASRTDRQGQWVGVDLGARKIVYSKMNPNLPERPLPTNKINF